MEKSLRERIYVSKALATIILKYSDDEDIWMESLYSAKELPNTRPYEFYAFEQLGWNLSCMGKEKILVFRDTYLN